MYRFVTILTIILFYSCVDDFDLKLDGAQPKLVVEGIINNLPGPYYVRLTTSNTGNQTSSGGVYPYIDNSNPVMDAKVIISDNHGLVDTLTVLNIDETEYDWTPGVGYFKLNLDENGNVLDTSFISEDFMVCNKRGYYITNKLTGKVNSTYFLTILWQGESYEASAFMPPVPKLDSVDYLKKILEKDGQEYYAPLISFAEPQDTANYYLILLHKESYYRFSSVAYLDNWEVSILSDSNLEPYVSELNVNLGYNPRGIEYITNYSQGDSIYVSLNSLTLESFNFYKALIDQFASDGGAYKPAPASPPGNISNGALGLFRASAVSEGTSDPIIWNEN
ncbi:MAG: DUF4249 domain-containing protein [Mangrovibacterium sp.]